MVTNNKDVSDASIKILSRHYKGAIGVAARMYDMLSEGYMRGEKPQTVAKQFKSLAKDYKRKQIPDGFIRLVSDVRKDDPIMFSYLKDVYKHLCIDKDWVEWGGQTESLNLVFGVDPDSIKVTSTRVDVEPFAEKANAEVKATVEETKVEPEDERKTELVGAVVDQLKRRSEAIRIIRKDTEKETSSNIETEEEENGGDIDFMDADVDGLSYEDGAPPLVHLHTKPEEPEVTDGKKSFKEKMDDARSNVGEKYEKFVAGVESTTENVKGKVRNIPWSWRASKARMSANAQMFGFKVKQSYDTARDNIVNLVKN